MAENKFERNLLGKPRFRVIAANGRSAVYDYKLLDVAKLDGKWCVYDLYYQASDVAEFLNSQEQREGA